MSGFFSQENNAVASWFLGPRAENSEFVLEFYKEIIDEQVKARTTDYFPTDPFFITETMQNSPEYKSNMNSLRAQLQNISDLLAKKTVPFWSPRYMAHMSMEATMPSNLGYLAALQYNQNNVAIEASPLTTWLEIFTGKKLCEMLGFTVHWDINESIETIDDEETTPPELLPKIRGWGHITCDGSVANLESIWYMYTQTRNLKFYPLSLRLAVDNGPLSFISSSFKVELANGSHKLLKECSTWELLNLKPTTVLDIPNQLFNKYGISSQFLQEVLNEKYIIQTVGKDYLEKMFHITESIVYFASETMHYSWPKGCAIVGIGSENLKGVPVDDAARMNIDKLKELLKKCVEKRQAVYAVVAIMGSTEHGACDPLGDIIELRKEFERDHGLSFVIHADAAWGGYFRSMLIKPHRSSLKCRRRPGLEEKDDSFVPLLALHPHTEKHLDRLKDCDSITVDPHKSGYVPYPAGGLCYRDQRMRYLVTWTSPVINRANEESIGIYGVEGSKPGAAAVATFLSQDAIGLHQKGYGLLLGQATFSCTKIYCHWATMSTKDDDFIVTPFNMLPAEKLGPKEVDELKQEIRTLIVEKTNDQIVKSKKAMKLIKELGSDLMINTFACNFKVDGKINEDVIEANYLNQRLYEKFSLTTSKDTNQDKPLVLTSTQFNQENYKHCLTNFKNRLGLKGDQDLYVLINVVMSPWVTEFESFLSVFRNKVEPDFHAFVMQGVEKLYLTHLPMFQMENHRQQVIVTADLPENIMHQYRNARRENPSHVYFLGNQDKMKLDDIARNGSSFKGVIYRDFDPNTGIPIEWIKDFQVTNVQVLKKRHLATKFQDANYPKDHMPFYIYGTEQELHIDHMLLKSPSIQLSADCVELILTSGELTSAQRENGVIVHFTEVREATMQSFPEIKPYPQTETAHEKSFYEHNDEISYFFFQHEREFHVELYNDPMPDPYQNGPGLDIVDKKNPIAKGMIMLPSRSKGCLYSDSYMINNDPTAEKKVKNGKITDRQKIMPIRKYYSEKFDHKEELHWYEEKAE
ncbi:pyridoxal phosphate-dependent transferase [Gigaspora rosea]|uniref:Pyridoxal phosphate-dependent transferase n=1 Tax=Gigaspora rosea TaxID=44941 RepID=A0A397VWB5_9GLOM|nr:pyridoxal phosphate-dependent transferase [Gigaspora rosea]